MHYLYFDGGSRGNPGISGSGWVIYKEKKEINSDYCFVSEKGTNNEAEYTGLIKGLEHAKRLDIMEIVVRGDSKLVLQQVQGLWKVNALNLKPYHKKAVVLKNKFESIKFEHIPRSINKEADRLANLAMDSFVE